MFATVLLGKEDLLVVPSDTQAQYITTMLFYLDQSVNLKESVPLLQQMRDHFIKLSKDKSNRKFAMYHYYASHLDVYISFFEDIVEKRCGLHR